MRQLALRAAVNRHWREKRQCLSPAFFFVLEKAAKSAGNAVIPTYPMHRSHGLQGFLKRCYTPLPYFHQWVSHIKRVLAQTPTNGPRSLSRTKAGTHSALLKESHTAAHRGKQAACDRPSRQQMGAWAQLSRCDPIFCKSREFYVAFLTGKLSFDVE